MCVALPVKIIKIEANYATVDLGDSQTSIVDTSLVNAKPGDYIIVNNGFALRVIDEEEARETIHLWNKMQETYQDG
jgi:hydrogenase expression/formation protein HypC